VKIQRDEIVRAVGEANIAAAEAVPDAEAIMKATLGLLNASEAPPAPTAAPATPDA
jgi:carbon storage regulator